MKCKNISEGQTCGAEIPPNSKFCGSCGCQVQSGEDSLSKECPKCKTVVTRRQKFCFGCGWKIDPSIFESKKVFCIGLNEEGKPCGEEILFGVRFCSVCGTDQSKPPPLPEISQRKENERGDFVKDVQQRHSPHTSETSGSSSRSDSPETWKPPGITTSTKDMEEENVEIMDIDIQKHVDAEQSGINQSDILKGEPESKISGEKEQIVMEPKDSTSHTDSQQSTYLETQTEPPSAETINEGENPNLQPESMDTEDIKSQKGWKTENKGSGTSGQTVSKLDTSVASPETDTGDEKTPGSEHDGNKKENAEMSQDDSSDSSSSDENEEGETKSDPTPKSAGRKRPKQKKIGEQKKKDRKRRRLDRDKEDEDVTPKQSKKYKKKSQQTLTSDGDETENTGKRPRNGTVTRSGDKDQKDKSNSAVVTRSVEAINECRNFDMEFMNDNRVRMRYDDLINVLERNLDQSQHRTPHQILSKAVTWAPFPSFIEMYCM